MNRSLVWVDHCPSEEEALAFSKWWRAGKKRVLDPVRGPCLGGWRQESCRPGVDTIWPKKLQLTDEGRQGEAEKQSLASARARLEPQPPGPQPVSVLCRTPSSAGSRWRFVREVSLRASSPPVTI